MRTILKDSVKRPHLRNLFGKKFCPRIFESKKGRKVLKKSLKKSRQLMFVDLILENSSHMKIEKKRGLNVIREATKYPPESKNGADLKKFDRY